MSAHGRVTDLVGLDLELGNGRLTPRNTDPNMSLLQEIATEKGTTVDALALAAVLAQPWVDVVLSGAAFMPQSA